jgi:hypothetical protein
MTSVPALALDSSIAARREQPPPLIAHVPSPWARSERSAVVVTEKVFGAADALAAVHWSRTAVTTRASTAMRCVGADMRQPLASGVMRGRALLYLLLT